MNRLLLALGALSLSGCATFHPVGSFGELRPGDVAEIRFGTPRDVTAASSTPSRVYPLAAVEMVRGPVLAVRGDTLMLNVDWVGSPTRPHAPAADARLFLVPEPTMEVGIRRNDRWRVAGVVALSAAFVYGLARLAGSDFFHTGFDGADRGAP
jgi:hypothetical protein